MSAGNIINILLPPSLSRGNKCGARPRRRYDTGHGVGRRMGDQGGRVLVGDGFLIGNSSRACCPSAKAGKTGSLVRDTNLHLQEFSRCCARGRARSGDLGSRPSPRFLLEFCFLPDGWMAGVCVTVRMVWAEQISGGRVRAHSRCNLQSAPAVGLRFANLNAGGTAPEGLVTATIHGFGANPVVSSPGTIPALVAMTSLIRALNQLKRTRRVMPL